MTYNYSPIAATALRMLTKFGADVTLRRYGEPVYDPTTLTATPTSVDYAIKGAKFDYTGTASGEVLQNGTLAQGADKQLLIAANSVRPTLTDHIIFADGGIWSIADIKATEPAGVAVLYECRLRQ